MAVKKSAKAWQRKVMPRYHFDLCSQSLLPMRAAPNSVTTASVHQFPQVLDPELTAVKSRDSRLGFRIIFDEPLNGFHGLRCRPRDDSHRPQLYDECHVIAATEDLGTGAIRLPANQSPPAALAA